MWAPADLFGPGFSAFTFQMKRVVTFFWEDPMALAIAFVIAAGLIAVANAIGDRRRGRA